MIDPAALLTAVTGGVVGIAGIAQAGRARRESDRQRAAATAVQTEHLHLEETQQALAAQSNVIASLERQADRAATRAEHAEQRARGAEVRARTAEEQLADCHAELRDKQ